MGQVSPNRLRQAVATRHSSTLRSTRAVRRSEAHMLAPVERWSKSARFDLTTARAVAEDAARHWDLSLGPPFATANVSYVAPAGVGVVKVASDGDDESLHEPDALELWNGDGAVRLLDRFGSALLEERALPGTDLSALDETDATAVAVELAARLWRPAQEPFRPAPTSSGQTRLWHLPRGLAPAASRMSQPHARPVPELSKTAVAWSEAGHATGR